jgi:hypothetical protein
MSAIGRITIRIVVPCLNFATHEDRLAENESISLDVDISSK